jgi:sterol desaturase/sphingolipid hydroxylase (fatty acid hydroxylase superfamily)
MEQADLTNWLQVPLEYWSGGISVLLFLLLAVIELALGRDSLQSSPASRFVTNFGLYFTGVAIGLAVPLTIAGAAAWADDNDFGVFQSLEAPGWIVVAVALLLRTFAGYWLHRAFHRVPLLWRFHRVHHSDVAVDVSLGLRHHPLELVPAILVFAGLAALLGLQPWQALLVELVMAAAAYWEHLAIRLPGRVRARLEKWMVIPETHRLHHSAHRPQTDSNFSSLTIIWDRMFGTFRPSSEPIKRIGLGEADDRIANHLGHQLLVPFRSYSETGSPGLGRLPS